MEKTKESLIEYLADKGILPGKTLNDDEWLDLREENLFLTASIEALLRAIELSDQTAMEFLSNLFYCITQIQRASLYWRGTDGKALDFVVRDKLIEAFGYGYSWTEDEDLQELTTSIELGLLDLINYRWGEEEPKRSATLRMMQIQETAFLLSSWYYNYPPI